MTIWKTHTHTHKNKQRVKAELEKKRNKTKPWGTRKKVAERRTGYKETNKRQENQENLR